MRYMRANWRPCDGWYDICLWRYVSCMLITGAIPISHHHFSSHVNHTPNAVARRHRAEAFIDLVERLAMCDELVNLQLAVSVILYKPAHLRSTFHTSERTTSPDATCHELQSYAILS